VPNAPLATRATTSTLLLAGLAAAGPAFAHDLWIAEKGYRDPVTGSHCCGVADCEALPDGSVVETRGGYSVAFTGEVIPFNRVLPSADSRFWRCRFLDGPKAGRTRCLFAPGPGS
jgi:hypothetical protein